MDLNKAMIIGNLANDPEVRTTTTGISVCSLGVATNFVWNDASGQKQTRVEFHNVVLWRRLAEVAGQYLKKGNKIYVEGRLETRSWEDQNGVKRYRTEIIGDSMIMLSSRPAGVGNNFEQQASSPAFTGASADKGEDSVLPVSSIIDQTQEQEIKVEDIPF